jgi:hypothetical protein
MIGRRFQLTLFLAGPVLLAEGVLRLRSQLEAFTALSGSCISVYVVLYCTTSVAQRVGLVTLCCASQPVPAVDAIFCSAVAVDPRVSRP